MLLSYKYRIYPTKIVARIHKKIANSRLDHIHKITNEDYNGKEEA